MKNKQQTVTLLTLIFLLLFAYSPTVHAASIIYVDANATGTNDGSSWANAYPNLQDALAVAIGGDEIWVAKGVYYPDEGSGQTVDDRNSTFQLFNSVAVYGGFVGTETASNQRDWETNVTILSGDIDGNDTNGDGNFIAETSSDIQGNNTYHVVTGSGVDETAVLDGFTITGGQANGADPNNNDGGGMINVGGSPALTHIIFSGNSASSHGAGMHNNGGNPALNYVYFSGNAANHGGGIHNINSNPILTNVDFSNNMASGNAGGMYNSGSNPDLANVTFKNNTADNDGGGMYNHDNSNPSLIDVTFDGNTAHRGGGMFNNDNSSPILTNATFIGNSSNSSSGGGMFNNGSSSPEITNAIFSGNTSSTDGGGMLNYDNSNPILTNVTFSGNVATVGGIGIHNVLGSNPTLNNCILWGHSGTPIGNDSSNPTVSYSLVEDGYAGTGNIDVNPLFVDADGIDNITGTADDDLRLQATSPAIDAGDNTAVPGNISTDLDGNARFIDHPWAANTGNGATPLVDMGAYENNQPGQGPGGVGNTTGTSSLMLWLKADDGTGQTNDGDAITSWADKSGHGNDVVQGVASNQPTFENDGSSLINNNPVVHFDGDDYLDGGQTTLNISNDHTIFVVKKDNAQVNRSYVAIEGTSSTNGLNVYRDNLNDKYIVQAFGEWTDDFIASNGIINSIANFGAYQRNDNDMYFWRNGGNTSTFRGTAGPIVFSPDARLTVGRTMNNNNSFLTGDIAEIIIFNEAINNVQRTLIENHLSSKYNTTLDTGNGANDVYTGDVNGFDVGIAGIGQESDGTNSIAFAGGMIVQNGTFLTDNGDYFVFGHNGAANDNSTENLPAGIEQRWQREWACTKTDVNDNAGTVNIMFDFSDGGMDNTPALMPSGDAGNYRLLKRNAVGDPFTDVTASSGATVSISEDRVIFSGIDTTDLCSQLTLGTVDVSDSPTAVSLQSLSASQTSSLNIMTIIIMALFVMGIFIIMRRRRA